MKADVDFLMSQNLMDYSMLLAIELLPQRKPSVESNRRRNTQAGRIDMSFEDPQIQRSATFLNQVDEIDINYEDLEAED